MLKTWILLGVVVSLAGCSSAGYQYANGDRKILYGVDGNGNALYRRYGEAPPRASAAQNCLITGADTGNQNNGCLPDAEDQTAAALNRR